jgi:hypothetical protein
VIAVPALECSVYPHKSDERGAGGVEQFVTVHAVSIPPNFLDVRRADGLRFHPNRVRQVSLPDPKSEPKMTVPNAQQPARRHLSVVPEIPLPGLCDDLLEQSREYARHSQAEETKRAYGHDWAISAHPLEKFRRA